MLFGFPDARLIAKIKQDTTMMKISLASITLSATTIILAMQSGSAQVTEDANQCDIAWLARDWPQAAVRCHDAARENEDEIDKSAPAVDAAIKDALIGAHDKYDYRLASSGQLADLVLQKDLMVTNYALASRRFARAAYAYGKLKSKSSDSELRAAKDALESELTYADVKEQTRETMLGKLLSDLKFFDRRLGQLDPIDRT